MLTKKTEFLNLASETLKSLNSSPIIEDECTIVGKRFAIQLRSMTEHQRLISEKIISDVMFYGRMEKLSENSFNYNPPQNIHHQQVPNYNDQLSYQQQTMSHKIVRLPQKQKSLISQPSYYHQQSQDFLHPRKKQRPFISHSNYQQQPKSLLGNEDNEDTDIHTHEEILEVYE